MSIVGQPQETHTVISSWEILDSPVPFRQPRVLGHRQQSPYNSTPDKPGEPLPLSADQERFESQQITPIGTTPALSSQHSGANFREQDTRNNNISNNYFTPELTGAVSPHTSDSTDRESDVREVVGNINTDEPPSAENSTIHDIHREPQSFVSGTATYVSTQPRQADNIADTIVTEFEQHVRRSQSSHRREYLENRGQRIHSEIIPEFSELHLQSQHSEVLHNTSDQGAAIQYREDTTESNEIERRSIDNSGIDRTSQFTNGAREPSELSQFPVARGHSEVRAMSVSSAANNNNEVPTTVSNNARESEVHTPQSNDIGQPNSGRVESYSSQSRQRRRGGVQTQRHGTGDQVSVRDSTANLASHNDSINGTSVNNPTSQAETVSQSDHQPPQTSSRDPTVEVTSRSVPDGGDFSPVRFGVEQGISPPGPNVTSPIYHPPPTIVQSGISQSDLLELMSKGLSNFTTEMAILVIDKLKPEYENIAKQAGKEVKEATVSELKELREKLRETEYKLESMSDERDFLKTQNIKDRDLLKREFEKDRLKRVKEFEEKNELIDKLKAETEKLQCAVKDKDKFLKRSDSKFKSEEAKRVKCEEECEKRLKDLQKELDKAKGEVLVLKSKKRVQTTSAAKSRKETLLGKLNSNYGMYPRKFQGHVPYDEGDDG